MEYLHAYWRMDYVEASKASKEGLFSDLPKTQDDKAVYIVWRGELTYLLMNTFPYNAGHLLALPYREVANPIDLTEDEQIALFKTVIFAQKLLQAVFKPDGFNVGMNVGKAGGAGIPKHLHMHIVPRWMGDTNFMPVLGQTRVLSKHLDTVWEALRGALATVAF